VTIKKRGRWGGQPHPPALRRLLLAPSTPCACRRPSSTRYSIRRRFEQGGHGYLERIRNVDERFDRQVLAPSLDALQVSSRNIEPFRELLLCPPALLPKLRDSTPHRLEDALGAGGLHPLVLACAVLLKHDVKDTCLCAARSGRTVPVRSIF
jgi:hypothetical protein